MRRTWVAAVVVAVSCSCGTPRKDCVAIGVDGGIAQFGDVTLTVPRDALDKEACLTGTVVTPPASAPYAGGPVLEFGPAGLQFHHPVELRMKLTDPASRAKIFTAETLEGPWTALPTSTVAGVAVAEVSHFSIFLPNVLRPQDCEPLAQGQELCVQLPTPGTCADTEAAEVQALQATCPFNTRVTNCGGLVGWSKGPPVAVDAYIECWYLDGGLIGSVYRTDTDNQVAGRRPAQACGWDAGC